MKKRIYQSNFKGMNKPITWLPIRIYEKQLSNWNNQWKCVSINEVLKGRLGVLTSTFAANGNDYIESKICGSPFEFIKQTINISFVYFWGANVREKMYESGIIELTLKAFWESTKSDEESYHQYFQLRHLDLSSMYPGPISKSFNILVT